MTRIIIYFLILIGVACISYYKGYKDQQIQSLATDITVNYVNLQKLEHGEIEIARENMITVLVGEHEYYQKLSKNILLAQPERLHPKLSNRFNEIDSYIKKIYPIMWPDSPPQVISQDIKHHTITTAVPTSPSSVDPSIKRFEEIDAYIAKAYPEMRNGNSLMQPSETNGPSSTQPPTGGTP